MFVCVRVRMHCFCFANVVLDWISLHRTEVRSMANLRIGNCCHPGTTEVMHLIQFPCCHLTGHKSGAVIEAQLKRMKPRSTDDTQMKQHWMKRYHTQICICIIQCFTPREISGRAISMSYWDRKPVSWLHVAICEVLDVVHGHVLPVPSIAKHSHNQVAKYYKIWLRMSESVSKFSWYGHLAHVRPEKIEFCHAAGSKNIEMIMVGHATRDMLEMMGVSRP